MNLVLHSYFKRIDLIADPYPETSVLQQSWAIILATKVHPMPWIDLSTRADEIEARDVFGLGEGSAAVTTDRERLARARAHRPTPIAKCSRAALRLVHTNCTLFKNLSPPLLLFLPSFFAALMGVK